MTSRTSAARDDSAARADVRPDVEELRAARKRLLAMAYRERRDFERRLHDGAQQDLVALAVNLQRAEELADLDRAALRRLLAEMRTDVRDAIEGLRGLARAIYPPLLADLGLAVALRWPASGVAAPGRIEVTVGRYSADMEAAVYFSCLDALELLAPAGQADRASLRVWHEREAVMFEVIVEGGPPALAEDLLNAARTAMNDRVRALDGTVAVVAEPERTRVLGSIPVG